MHLDERFVAVQNLLLGEIELDLVFEEVVDACEWTGECGRRVSRAGLG